MEEEKKEEILSPIQPEQPAVDVTEADKQLDYDRDARVLPVVRKLYELLNAKEDLMIGMTPKGMTTPEFQSARVKNYIPIAEEIIKVMIENHVRVSEVKYCIGVAREAMELSMKFVENTVDSSMETVSAKLFGRNDINDIEVADVEKHLTNKE